MSNEDNEDAYIVGCPTDEQKHMLEQLNIGCKNIALLSAQLDGIQIGMVVAIQRSDDNHMLIVPVAVLTDAAFLAHFSEKLLDPLGRHLTQITPPADKDAS